MLPPVLPLVQEELHLSNLVGGFVVTIFLVGYFVTSPLFGHLADRTDVPGGRKGLLALGVGVWSAATFASGLARGPASLMAARATVGVGEASYGTIAPTIIDDMAPSEKKGRWLSIFYVAIPVGSALGFAIGGKLSKIGWREAFFFVGAPGIVAALLCLAFAEPARAHARERVDWKRSVRTLLTVPLYRRAVFGYCAQTFAVGGFGAWAPKYLHAVYAVPLDKAGVTFGAILCVAGLFGTFAGGWLADRWTGDASGDDTRASLVSLRVCAWSSALGAPLAAACFLAPSAPLFFALAFFTEAAIFASTSPINAVILRAVPKELRASAMALSIFAIHMFGDLWSPPLLGWAQDVMPAAIAMMGVPVAIAASAILWWERTNAATAATSSLASR